DHGAARRPVRAVGQALRAVRRPSVSDSCEVREPALAHVEGGDRKSGREGVDGMKTLPVIQPAQAEAPAEKRPLETTDMVNDPERYAALKPRILSALRTVFDPEIPVNIYDLGLIYDVIVESSGRVGIRMTLTAPACPAAQFLPGQVKAVLESVPDVTDALVDVIWDPPWSRDRMSDAAKLQLGLW